MLITYSMTKKPKPQFRRDNLFKKWRLFRKMTLEKASEKAGMTAGNLSAMERGAQGYTQGGLEALAQAYRCKPADLLSVDPTKDKAIWTIWESADTDDRRKIVDIAKTIVGATDDSH